MVAAVASSLLLGGCWGARTDLSSERLVFQTDHGNLELAFYPQVRSCLQDNCDCPANPCLEMQAFLAAVL